MTSTGVNVLRWSALAFGVVYGVYHQTQISTADKLRENHAEYQRKQQLINQAKAEFAKKNAPKDQQSNANLSLESPNFDLEGWLKSIQ